jgi:serine/threonine protein kinase
VVKGVRHPRIQNERDVLQRFQHRAIRPLIDEIIEPTEPPGIVLRHLDSDLLSASLIKRLTRSEIKDVAKTVLLVLVILHNDGYVHTG